MKAIIRREVIMIRATLFAAFLTVGLFRQSEAILIDIDPGAVGTTAPGFVFTLTDLEGLQVSSGSFLDLELRFADDKFIFVPEEPGATFNEWDLFITILFEHELLGTVFQRGGIQLPESIFTDENGDSIPVFSSFASIPSGQPSNGLFTDLGASVFADESAMFHGTNLHILLGAEFDGASESTITSATVGWVNRSPTELFEIRQSNSGPVVPEPTSIAIWSLLGLLMIGFGFYRIRRKK